MKYIEASPEAIEYGEQVMKEAFKKLPRKIWQTYPLILLSGGLSATVLSVLGSGHPWELSSAILGGAAYITGRILDKQSTISTLKEIEKAKSEGLYLSIKESNPLLPDFPTNHELFFGKPFRVEVASTAVSVLYPPIGFGLAIQSLLATLNNFRAGKQIDHAIEIHRENQKGDI